MVHTKFYWNFSKNLKPTNFVPLLNILNKNTHTDTICILLLLTLNSSHTFCQRYCRTAIVVGENCIGLLCRVLSNVNPHKAQNDNFVKQFPANRHFSRSWTKIFFLEKKIFNPFSKTVSYFAVVKCKLHSFLTRAHLNNLFQKRGLSQLLTDLFENFKNEWL